LTTESTLINKKKMKFQKIIFNYKFYNLYCTWVPNAKKKFNNND